MANFVVVYLILFTLLRIANEDVEEECVKKKHTQFQLLPWIFCAFTIVHVRYLIHNGASLDTNLFAFSHVYISSHTF